jgi:hypothetical protein
MQVHTVNSNSRTSSDNVAYFQRKIQLSGFSAYLDGLPSYLIRVSGVTLYGQFLGHVVADLDKMRLMETIFIKYYCY